MFLTECSASGQAQSRPEKMLRRIGSHYNLCRHGICWLSQWISPANHDHPSMIAIDGRPYIDEAGEFVLFK
jgi:hypothetical protein